MDYTVHAIFQARILEWVAFLFSRGSSQPRDRTQVSHTAGGFFSSWGTRMGILEQIEEWMKEWVPLPLSWFRFLYESCDISVSNKTKQNTLLSFPHWRMKLKLSSVVFKAFCNLPWLPYQPDLHELLSSVILHALENTVFPHLGRRRDGTPLQYFCLENPVDWGAW